MATPGRQEQVMVEQLLAPHMKPRGHPKRPQAAQPYLRLNRADVLRILLDEGLPAAS
jgi:hypothetical protein